MALEKNGWIKLHRKLLDSAVFANPKLLKMWVWCLCKASHKGYETMVGNQIVQLQEGQFIFGRQKASVELKLKESMVYDYIKLLENLGMVNIKSNNKFSVVTVEKWAFYQGEDDENQHQNQQQINNKSTTNQQQINTNKNVKNAKNEKNEKNTISDSGEPEPPAPPKKPKEKTVKNKYGEFQHVLLTENEFAKLANDFGVDLRDKAIRFLDEYIEEKDYKSKSHNLAIRRWVIDAVKEQEQKKGRGRKEAVPSWMNKKSSAEKYMDYGQRQYSSDEMDDLEAKLLGVKTAGNDPGIAARAEELKKQFS